MNALWQVLPAAHLTSSSHLCRKIRPLSQALKKAEVRDVTASITVEDSLLVPRLDKPSRSFACYVKGYSCLGLTDRALVALRSAHLSKMLHALPDITLAALDYGLQPSDIKLIINGRYAPGWSLKEQLLIKVTDDLYKKGELDEKVWKRLTALYSYNEILDIIFCIAAFHLCTL
ncbi:MAG: hypothetical protein PUP46_00120 [Endozoicomonas sp. (ex Botrylloides leachii)]|nr:hypothetical protein [Endozoicomonas sp. (ex Botrylloides leachii)]